MIVMGSAITIVMSPTTIVITILSERIIAMMTAFPTWVKEDDFNARALKNNKNACSRVFSNEVFDSIENFDLTPFLDEVSLRPKVLK